MMLEINVNELIAISLVVGIFGLGIALSSLMKVGQQSRRLAEIGELLAASAGERLKLEGELQALRDRFNGQGVRIDGLERQVERMEIQPEGRAFNDAISMAERGASHDALEKDFGLSEGEAVLVARMHRRESTS